MTEQDKRDPDGQEGPSTGDEWLLKAAEQLRLPTFEAKLDFVARNIVNGDGSELTDPETAQVVYDMELYFGEEITPEISVQLKAAIGVDFEAEPDAVVTSEENVDMKGWKTTNPNWYVVRWVREDGVQLLTYERAMFEEFVGSMGMTVKFKEVEEGEQ